MYFVKGDELIEFSNFRKGWSLIDKSAKRSVIGLLALGALVALMSALMVGSVLPFFTVIAKPETVMGDGALAWAYSWFGFSSTYDFAIAVGVLALLIIIVANSVMILDGYLFERASAARKHTITKRLMGMYLEQPYEYFLDADADVMMSKLLSEIEQMEELLFRSAIRLWTSLLSSCAIIALIIVVDPVVALVAFAVVGGAYFLAHRFSHMVVRRLGEQRIKDKEDLFRIAKEALGGIKTIKILGREQVYLDRFSRPSRSEARSISLMRLISSLPRFVVHAVTIGGVVLAAILMLDPSWFTGNASLGDLLPVLGVFAFAGQRLVPSIQMIFTSLTELQYSRPVVESVFEEFSTLQDTGGLPLDTVEPLRFKDELQLRRVCYNYPLADRAGLKDIDFSITAGERIGIIGGTGAGKTTLVDLILGMLRPESGSIVVDGVALEDSNIRNWQRSVGYVPQEIFLADSTIAENIAFGVPPDEIDMDRVESSARIAGLERLILDELPQGYQTKTGERGVRLSGGQRQRIGVARALYGDTDLIVFDEATSALDNLTEIGVMGALQKLSGTKTMLIVAHRLSTIKFCDRIVVMDAGRVDEIDTYEALSSHNNLLKALLAAGDSARPVHAE